MTDAMEEAVQTSPSNTAESAIEAKASDIGASTDHPLEASMNIHLLSANIKNELSTDDSDSDAPIQELSLQERRAMKMDRNDKLLHGLGLMKEKRQYFVRKTAAESILHDDPTESIEVPRKSMTLSIPKQSSRIDLLQKYPHREEQIRLLSALLDMASVIPSRHAPAPIFVTGPSGSGKTSITCDVIHNQRLEENVLDVYVNVATLKELSVATLIKSIASQFKKRHLEKNSYEARMPMSFADDNKLVGMERTRTLVHRSAKRQKMTKHKDYATSMAKNPVSAFSEKLDNDGLTMVASLGRYLQKLFGMSYHGVLILDHAERLLMLKLRKNSPEQFNLFAQLLLMPKTLGLNLTTIMLSKNILLDHTCKCTMFMESTSILSECICFSC
jgi:hypothetical protein